MIATKGVGNNQLARLLLQANWQGSFEGVYDSHVVDVHQVIEVGTGHVHEAACVNQFHVSLQADADLCCICA